MSWLDQIRARRANRETPDDGKAMFSNYEFTEDRREQNARELREAGAAGNIFENAKRAQRQMEPAPNLDGGPVEPVRFEGDELDRDAAEKVERGAPRRSAKRIRTPVNLYYFPTPDHFVPLELTVIYRDGRTKAVDCFLHDVNDSGIGFVAPESFPEGSELTVLGSHAEDMTPLIATNVHIVSSRPFQDDKPRPEKFSGRSLWLHGTRMEIHDAMLLYKATLDSIALAVALQENPAVDASAKRPGPDEDPQDDNQAD